MEFKVTTLGRQALNALQSHQKLWPGKRIFILSEDNFELYDLKVEWVPGDKPCWCGAKSGDCFYLRGEHLEFPPSQTWSIYTLSALLPLLPAKQRETDPNDWMSTDNLVACPDPNCGSRFRISRLERRTFSHGDTTTTPIPKESSE